MEAKDSIRKVIGKKKSKIITSNNKLKNLKSDYFIRKFFEYIPKRKSLEIIKYNKNIQKRIDINKSLQTLF